MDKTNFSTKKFLIWKEVEKGVIPSGSFNAYSTTLLNYSVAEDQAKSTNPTLGNGGQGSTTDYGTSSFAGNIEVKYSSSIMPIMVTHTIGAGTREDLTTSAWEDETIYTAGQVVNVGITHSLVCKKGGTSGLTTPVLTGLVDSDTVEDGTVVWYVRVGKLQKYEGGLRQCLTTFGMEMQSETGCDDTPEVFTERYLGVYINGFEIAKQDGTIIYQYSVPALASSKIDSEQEGFADLTPASEIVLKDNAYGYDDLEIKIGGVLIPNARSFRMTINRNTAVVNSINKNEKIDNTPIPTVDGELQVKFTRELYKEVYNNPKKEVVATFSKPNGDKAVFSFPAVEFHRSPLSYTTNEPIYMTIPLNATGSSTVKTVNYEVHSTTVY
jgi:hypothetical protein